MQMLVHAEVDNKHYKHKIGALYNVMFQEILYILYLHAEMGTWD